MHADSGIDNSEFVLIPVEYRLNKANTRFQRSHVTVSDGYSDNDTIQTDRSGIYRTRSVSGARATTKPSWFPRANLPTRPATKMPTRTRSRSASIRTTPPSASRPRSATLRSASTARTKATTIDYTITTDRAPSDLLHCEPRAHNKANSSVFLDHDTPAHANLVEGCDRDLHAAPRVSVSLTGDNVYVQDDHRIHHEHHREPQLVEGPSHASPNDESILRRCLALGLEQRRPLLLETSQRLGTRGCPVPGSRRRRPQILTLEAANDRIEVGMAAVTGGNPAGTTVTAISGRTLTLSAANEPINEGTYLYFTGYGAFKESLRQEVTTSAATTTSVSLTQPTNPPLDPARNGGERHEHRVRHDRVQHRWHLAHPQCRADRRDTEWRDAGLRVPAPALFSGTEEVWNGTSWTTDMPSQLATYMYRSDAKVVRVEDEFSVAITDWQGAVPATNGSLGSDESFQHPYSVVKGESIIATSEFVRKEGESLRLPPRARWDRPEDLTNVSLHPAQVYTYQAIFNTPTATVYELEVEAQAFESGARRHRSHKASSCLRPSRRGDDPAPTLVIDSIRVAPEQGHDCQLRRSLASTGWTPSPRLWCALRNGLQFDTASGLLQDLKNDPESVDAMNVLLAVDLFSTSDQ